MSYQQRWCDTSEIRFAEGPAGRAWPAGDVLLASVTTPHARCYVLSMPPTVLAGEKLTEFLAGVAPFGCPPPPSLVRAYSLPDAPFRSILVSEHEEAPDGTGGAYRRFVIGPRRHWLAALQSVGPGLCPLLAWRAEPERRLLAPDEWGGVADDARLDLAGIADGYLGRGLLLLADPSLTQSWQTMMSLGGPTKARKITGREFPVWVDLPAHRSTLLTSPLLARVERLLAEV